MTGLAERMRAELGERAVLLDGQDLAPYLQSARHGAGLTRGVIRPSSLAAISWTVAELVRSGEPFVVQGAATGLVAGATPSRDGRQWVLSTQSLRDRLEIDPLSRSAVVSAGHRLSDLNRTAAKQGLCFPIDLGADPTLGGMIATNTGGARLIRYGGVRENLLGLQGVLLHPPGQAVGQLHGLRKNNTGLDWSQLLCGSFGAFGLVTHAVVKLHALPRQTATALLALPSAAVGVQLLADLEAELGDFVTAFEGISGPALAAVVRHLPGATAPFAELPVYAVLVELTSTLGVDQGLDLNALLLSWLERQMESGAELLDAVVDKPEKLWRLRHGLSEAVQHLGRMLAFDLSVTRSRFAPLREQALAVIAEHLPDAQVCDFGHLGDGGMHLNFVVPWDTAEGRIAALREAIYDLTVREFGGSYSAEHGVGPSNSAFYHRYTDAATLDWAAALHRHFDPARLLGNVRLDQATGSGATPPGSSSSLHHAGSLQRVSGAGTSDTP
ncbi:FAD-binding oxidoreductase [Roseateles sp. P5_D6]